jgi:NSS family neurotransmitter:Na+ symporter
MQTSRIAQWSSRWLFILAATGSAVGLGNVWRFPYITGQNGGGAFVLMYIGLVLLIGMPVLMAEIMIGRRGAQNPVQSVANVAVESGLSSRWGWLGFAGILTSFFLLSIYSVVAGWSAAYVIRTFSGSFHGLSPLEVAASYDAFIASPGALVFWHTVFIVATGAVVARGLREGLEKAIEILVPGLFIILLILIGYAITTPGFKEGISFLLMPNFEAITAKSFLTALGQAFFTLSIATASMLIYGAYLPKDASIFKASLCIAGLDTLAALLAGIAIFPIVFSYGLTPTEGPGLVFKTLPIAFGEMPYGTFFGGLFFTLLVFAALTSAISMVEPMVAWITQRFNIKRVWATVWAAGSAWFVGLGAALSFNVWADYRLFGRFNYYDLLDILVTMILLPAGGLMLAVFGGWFVSRRISFEELAMPVWVYNIWRFSVRYFAPIAVAVMVWMMVA